MSLFTRPVWKFRSVRIIAFLIALWLLLALITALVLPRYIKNIAVQQITEQTGRKVDIDKISFNLFSFSVYVHDFTLYDTDKVTPQFSAKELITSASLSSLFHLAPVLDRITLIDPKVHIVRLDDKDTGTYNFSDILNRFKKPDDQTPEDEANKKPFYFALNNVNIDNGSILLEDKVTGKNIDIQKLNVSLPYFSNFPSKNPITIAPSLSADINGTPLKITAEKPLNSDTLPSKANIHLDRLDITQYLPFVPAKLPVSIQSAEISSDLALTFSPSENEPSLVLNGTVQLDNIDVQDNQHQPLLKTNQIKATLTNLDALKLSGEITQLTVDQPEVWATLAKNGKINWVETFASNDDKDKPKTVTDFNLKQLNVNNGTVHWGDAAYAHPSIDATLNQIQINATNIATSDKAPAGSFSVSAVENKQGNLLVHGTLQPTTLNLNSQIEVKDMNLANYESYVGSYLDAQFKGALSANATVTMADGITKVSDIATTINQFNLTPRHGGGITATTLALVNGNLDLQEHLLNIDAINLNQVNAQVIRNKAGQINLIPVSKAPSKAQAPATKKSGKSAAETPWKITLNNLTLDKSSVSYTDEGMTRKQPLSLQNITLNAQGISSALDRPATLQLNTAINQSGRLSLSAKTSAQLKETNVDIDLTSLPVTPFQSFVPDSIKIAVVSGNVSTKGKLQIHHVLDSKQRTIQYKGNAALQRFNVLDDTTKIPFLRFAKLNLGNIYTRFDANRPVISVNKVSLNSFYARAVLTEKGKLNISQLVSSDTDTDNTPADQPAEAKTPEKVTEPAKDDHSPIIRIGDVNLAQGQINFTDNFVKPNYHVNLTGLTGTIGAVDSTKAEPAPVDLHAKIDNDSPVLINGSMNPLFKPLFLDIKATATGVELPQLTPYSSKYAGYPIEKGKLSATVNYKIEDQHLVASNNVKIDQLTFGDHVDGPDATKLPVMLAVSLLKDRNGVIDLDIPISGSLEDPQFSIGGVILRAVVNLIVKAVTSPFSLISSMFGGGEELSHLEFASGSSDVTPDLIKKLDSLNYALSERPGLSLDIMGKADINSDKAGLVNQQLLRQMKMLKWQDNGKKGSPVDVNLSAQDEQKYLTVLYKKASFKKPTNFIGLSKSEPVDEMKRLFVENTTVSEQDLRNLANERATNIKAYIETQGNIPNERVFIIAPKIVNNTVQEKEPNMGVDFTLK